MKIKILVATLVFCLNLFVFTTCTNAQATVIDGPSDTVSNPPASASEVNKVPAPASSIFIKIGSGTGSSASDINFQWYKLDSVGVKNLVQSSSNNMFMETAAGAGYYIYQLVISNANQCTPKISNLFRVYVLPALNPTITVSSSTINSNGTSTTVLTANPDSDKFSYLYQWSVNGSDIFGAMAITYAATATNTDSSTYTLTVSYTLNSSVTGTASHMVKITAVTCLATGTILREEWDNMSGTSISDIPLKTTPSSTSQLTSFEGSLNVADNYGSRIRGYICPPQTRNYIFWIATDDDGELWLSTDSAVTNKVRIANVDGWTNYREWNKYFPQQSAAITLQAGKKYYIEALQKEAGVGDNLSVQWQLPDASMETPIAGSHLSPYVDTTALINQTIAFTAFPSKTTSNTPFTLTASASSGLALSFSVVSGPATISDSTITLTGKGIVTVEASQAGNSVYNTATAVTQSFTVSSDTTCSATGTILREEWDNVGGTSISDVPLTTTPSSASS